jgi:hypothetical protein
MSKGRARVLDIGLWVFGTIPAALIMMWLGNVEESLIGFLKAWGILLALILFFDLTQKWVAGIFRRRRENNPAGTPER